MTNYLKIQHRSEEMSRAISKLNYILALGILRQDPTLQNELINLEDSFFWLNELAEVLNPYLSLE
jgi:hypothetical protein